MATLDPEYEKAVAVAKEAGAAPADPLKTPLAEARKIQHRYFAFLAGQPPAVASTQEHALEAASGPFKVRLHFPSTVRPLPVLVFTRGAGWWAGDLDSHDRTTRLLANKSGMAVCGVDYHCAPEARFPAQLEELLAAVRWLRGNGAALGVDPARIVLAGESAGATLSALAAARLGAGGEPQVSGLVLFYGNLAGPSEKSRAYSRWVWSNFLGTDRLPADPAAVPAQAGLAGFPPVWLGAGECDPLIEDSLEFAGKLEAAGIPHELKRYPGVPHAFVMMSRLYPGADAALDDAARVAREFAGLAPAALR
jgi:acetyl esterase